MSDNDLEERSGPGAPPDVVSQRSGVRRVNNRPMYILAGAVGMFLLAMAMVAADRAVEKDVALEALRETGGSTQIFAEAITGDRMDGMIESAMPLIKPEPEEPLQPAEPQVLIVRSPDPLGGPPLPPHEEGGAKHDNEELERTQEELRLLQIQFTRLQDQMRRPQRTEAEDAEAPLIRDAKLDLLQQAIAAKTGVEFAPPRETLMRSDTVAAIQENIDALRSNPGAAYKARVAQIRASGLLGGDASTPTPTGRAFRIRTDAGPTGIGSAEQGISNTGNDSRWQLGNQLEVPGSPYELRAGFVVPGTLISGINSDLPGTIMAQVSQNVYDTATGRHLLIPQGARLIGTYSSDVVFGQSRVLVAWQRIVFPDGKALRIESLPGADGAGYAGFTDQVNNHYFRIFASALLMSGITTGVSLSQSQSDSGDDSDDNPTFSDEWSRALGQQLGEVSTQLIEKNLSIAPTLEVRPGYRFNVIVVKDMTFPQPYQAFDY